MKYLRQWIALVGIELACLVGCVPGETWPTSGYGSGTSTGGAGGAGGGAVQIDPMVCGNGVLEGSEQCDGSANCDMNCNITTPGLGESRQTAEPFPGCPIAPSSAARVDPPSCFPQSEAVYWYSYVTTDEVISVSADAAGPVALYDSAGSMIGCVLDATERPLAHLAPVGTTYYVAVTAPAPMTCLIIDSLAYTGVHGPPIDLNITFPSDATAERSMAASADQIFLGTPSTVFSAPKSGGVVASEHGALDGLGVANLGMDIYLLKASLFSMGQAPDTSRLFRIFHQVAGWGPVPWDNGSSYSGNTVSHTLTFDGSMLISATHVANPMTGELFFYGYDPSMAAPAQVLGVVSAAPPTPVFDGVVGLAADAQYFYVVGRSPAGEGLYRLDRGNLTAPPRDLFLFNADAEKMAVAVDDYLAARNLYLRDGAGNIHVIMDPGGVALYLGVISTLGVQGDYAMTYDRFDDALYFFETESDGAGRIAGMK